MHLDTLPTEKRAKKYKCKTLLHGFTLIYFWIFSYLFSESWPKGKGAWQHRIDRGTKQFGRCYKNEQDFIDNAWRQHQRISEHYLNQIKVGRRSEWHVLRSFVSIVRYSWLTRSRIKKDDDTTFSSILFLCLLSIAVFIKKITLKM